MVLIIKKYILIIFLVYPLLSISAYAQTRKETIDKLNNSLHNNENLIQSDINDTAAKIYKLTDEELTDIYTQILNEYRNDKTFIEKFKEAQKAWIKYRNAHLDSIYPDDNKQKSYGTIFPMCYYIELTRLTNARIKQLSLWANGIEEGDACIGSRKLKINKK